MTDEQNRHRVVAAVLVDSGRVLLCHRRADRRWYPDCWDLPGGHVEVGETEREALSRECAEELGIVVVEARRLLVVDDPAIHMTVMRVVVWEGVPADVATEEHDAVAWCGATELSTLPVADDRYRPLLTRLLTGS